MNIEGLIQMLRSRNGESKICVEVDGKRLQVASMEIDDQEQNGFKLILAQPVESAPAGIQLPTKTKKADPPPPPSTTDVV